MKHKEKGWIGSKIDMEPLRLPLITSGLGRLIHRSLNGKYLEP